MKTPAWINERRAPVQADQGKPPNAPCLVKRFRIPKPTLKGGPGWTPGTIAWSEHVEAWQVYDNHYRNGQSAEQLAQRGGFGWYELVMYLGREPVTWRPL